MKRSRRTAGCSRRRLLLFVHSWYSKSRESGSRGGRKVQAVCHRDLWTVCELRYPLCGAWGFGGERGDVGLNRGRPMSELESASYRMRVAGTELISRVLGERRGQKKAENAWLFPKRRDVSRLKIFDNFFRAPKKEKPRCAGHKREGKWSAEPGAQAHEQPTWRSNWLTGRAEEKHLGCARGAQGCSFSSPSEKRYRVNAGRWGGG